MILRKETETFIGIYDEKIDENIRMNDTPQGDGNANLQPCISLTKYSADKNE